ncbi:MAG: hypothetical protein EXQ84_06800 [Rhodospirillaceae bacterium]|nr:hypothetical protein [Rhodospirillaceae bacterium]
MLVATPAASKAAVTDTAGNGFSIQQTVVIAATPPQVYAALTHPAAWWASAHTFSGDAANMTMDARPGGCWCEKLGENGGVQHMTVTFAAPGAVLILRGSLGPFYDAPVDAVL